MLMIAWLMCSQILFCESVGVHVGFLSNVQCYTVVYGTPARRHETTSREECKIHYILNIDEN